MNDQFVIENLQYVFGVDALETSRPINIEVNTPAEISSLFDAISYEKGKRQFIIALKMLFLIQNLSFIGSCVLRMCADILGIETFKRGLTRYLSTKYG